MNENTETETLDKNAMDQDTLEKTENNRFRFIIIGLIFVSILAAIFILPVKSYIISALEWTENIGIWAPLVVVAFYIASCVLFLPGSLITLGAGLLFGVVKGTIVVSIGSTLGAVSAFLVGRTLLRDWVSRKVSGNTKFNAIDKAVGDQGFKIVFLTRLSPVIPFNLLNYAFGLTRVSTMNYFLASWIGMLPATVMYVYFGSALRSLTDLATGSVETGAPQQVFFWIGLVATIIVVVIVTRIATKAFKEAVE